MRGPLLAHRDEARRASAAGPPHAPAAGGLTAPSPHARVAGAPLRRSAVFSDRSSQDFTPNALAAALGRRAAMGGDLLDLTRSNPTACGIEYPRDLLQSLAHPRGLGYAPDPRGHFAARAAIAAEWRQRGVPSDPERLLLTASTSEAYAFLFKLLCDPGDEILVPQPSYPLFEHLARYEAVHLVPYRIAYDGAWHIDLDSLRRARGPRTRGVLVVSPNNPTGNYLKSEELAALLSEGVPIISDEVFASFAFRGDPRRVASVLATEAGLVFALGGLSKLVALPQLKVSWVGVAGASGLVSDALERLELIADTYLSVSTPAQLALPELLRAGGGAAKAVAARTQQNLELVRAACQDGPLTVLDVEGGWYAVLRAPALDGVEDLALHLVERDGVLVQPGWFYDFEREHHLVISLLTPSAELVAGLERLRRRVDEGCR